MASGSWLVCLKPREAPRRTLVCFPFGGGGAGVFWEWRTAIPEDVEIWAVRLPGRESRAGEAFITSSARAVASIVQELRPLMRDRSCVFFGHSLGAGLAYQTAMSLRDHGEPLPGLFIASGRLPPHKPYPGRWGHSSDEALLAHVVGMGGVPEELWRHDSFREVHLPRIRADFLLNEDLFYGRADPFEFDITAINGREDPLVDDAGLQEWRAHTHGRFRSFQLDGGHFVLQTHAAGFLELVRRELEESSAPREPRRIRGG
ncbi:thioesterase II family protein [Myxococcus stipitatus]|uniref:thioesterase II family protein n=1 Tax=Myxococcus stipitatus TaxID=83455 RepID=UPI0030D5A552